MDFTCPHCGQPLVRWANPQLSNWSGAFQYVCFHDECPYFVRGWEWMRSQYNVHASYRYRLDPTNGEHGPLPVWSRAAMKDSILQDSDTLKDPAPCPSN